MKHEKQHNMKDLKEKLLSNPRNQFIEFDRVKHEYYYTKGKRQQFHGVTSWIGQYKNPFDRMGKSANTARKLGISQQEVLEMWDDNNKGAIDYGNSVHDAVEEYFTHGLVNETYETEIDNADRILELYGIEVIACEFVVYDETVKRASPIDIVGYRASSNEIVVVDTKTPEKGIKYEGYNGQKMLYPFRYLDDCSYNHYSMQTTVYRKWLKELYNLPVAEDAYLLYLRGDAVEMIPTVDMTEEIQELYNLS
jgi:hypothetical protein